MDTYTKGLGRALAILPLEQKDLSDSRTGETREYIRHVKNRYQELKRNGNLSAILEKLPEHSCITSRPFLENNEDFFIALFSDTKHDVACVRLYKHMNDCYPCFEIFSQVLRDYYYEGEALRDLYGEKRHG